MYKKYIKRFFDFTFSLILIIALLPLYFIISILVLINMGAPILFSQKRIGKDEKVFKLYKFRTMITKTEKNGIKLSDKERLTKFGIILRSTSLDELPELFLILVGKMSFVGPRPQPLFYGPYYKDDERIIHTVKGGLLPPDSLCKEPQCSWEEQFEYEKYYAANVNFKLDVKIIFFTIIILIKRVINNYGADDRPMLNEYRKNMNIDEQTKIKWKMKEEL